MKGKTCAAEPIKDPNDIKRISDYLVAKNRYRDNLLFVAGINFGFRLSDLLKLKWGHLLNCDGILSINPSFALKEGKTGRFRTVFINRPVMDAICAYTEQLRDIDLDAFVFRSNRKNRMSNTPLSVRRAELLLKEVINEDLGINIQSDTHCLRKTFGYHLVMAAPDKVRAVELLREVFGHPTEAITRSYIGIEEAP